MILIADSSALVALASCNSLSFLDTLFHQVFVPKEVYDEIAVKGKQYSNETI
jgi:predicted nucleic acid-binding protein